MPATPDRLWPAARGGASISRLADVGFGPDNSPVPGVGFADLYRSHRPTCLRLARRLLRDDDLAQDVVQEVFLAVWRSATLAYRADRGEFRAWLCGITYNIAVSTVRTRERERRHAEATAPSGPTGPDDAAWATIRVRRLHQAMTGLPAEQAQAIRLAYFADLTQAQIAQHVGVPVSTVKYRMRTAMHRLREPLTDLGSEAPADAGRGTAVPRITG